ncbi:hypothetical protein A134_11940 [Vibrio crassostreae 9CS106]|nr:hypothetical protein A134_11940 [Vibrio crassostreae 9CS106]
MKDLITIAILFLLLTLHLLAMTYLVADVTSFEMLSSVGSLLSGLGTILLVIIALKTVSDWKKQVNHQHCLDLLSKLDDIVFLMNEHSEILLCHLPKSCSSEATKNDLEVIELIKYNKVILQSYLHQMTGKKTGNAFRELTNNIAFFSQRSLNICYETEQKKNKAMNLSDIEKLRDEFREDFLALIISSTNYRSEFLD